ncbi:hypothetical protein [Streptomyces sp. NPDC059979]|uniref:hypothetical protein n=1 Tax=unclassified Streptomyces TaxID=2593676 RepID=UPI00365BCB6D
MLTTRAETRPERTLYELLDQLVPELTPGIEWKRQMRLLVRHGRGDEAIEVMRALAERPGGAEDWIVHTNRRRPAEGRGRRHGWRTCAMSSVRQLLHLILARTLPFTGPGMFSAG